MTSKPILRGIGLATAAALLASGLALQRVTALYSTQKSTPRTEKSDNQKSTVKKKRPRARPRQAAAVPPRRCRASGPIR
jgi:hypothetical protein